ncbi:nitroreductase [Saccharothrix stipae]
MDDSTWNGFVAILEARHSKRSFVAAEVPARVLEQVLRAAATAAPSSRNGQPWRVEVLRGDRRDELARALCDQFDRGVPTRPDYAARPARTTPEADARAHEAGAGVLRAKGVARDDEQARRRHLRDNLAFYGAPVELILHLPADAVPGQFLELGMFVQGVVLGLVACRLGSCPQVSVAGYPDTVREVLGLGADRLVVCGLAVGYPDETAPVNAFHPRRAELSEYVRWHGAAPG